MPDDYSATTQTTGTVEVGGSARGEIETTDDSDAFAVELVAGRTYRIDLEGAATDKGTLADPFLRWLRDSSGNGLHGTRDYDGGEGLNPRQVFTPQVSGTYYITASGQGDSVGTYTLTVAEILPDDIGDSIGTTGRVTVGTSLTGEIETTDDSDAYAVELVAGRTYRIDLEGAAIDKGTLADPFLRWLRDSSGNGLHGTRDYDGGEGLNPRQVFTPQVSGTYYITASGQGDSVGTYTLTVAELQQGGPQAGQAPVFSQPSYAFDLAENADGVLFGIAVAPVVATDPDNGTITFSIEAGDPDGLFMIDAATGLVVYLGTGEDYESGTTSYELTVRASDGSLHSDVIVTVNVTDVAEAPVFAETSYTFSLAENAGGDTIPLSLGLVQATDPENSTIVYSIEAGDPGGLFEIDAATGALSYRGAGEDYESGTTSYDLTVRASDPVLYSEVTVTISVTDVADEEEYVSLQQEASVSEPDGEDLPANTSTTGVVAVGGSARGKIAFGGDRDWFAVTLEEGRSYRIDLEGNWTGKGTLSDSYLYGVHDADGVLIAGTKNADGGVGGNSRVTFTTQDAGIHYVAAGGYRNHEGTYKLSVAEYGDDFAAGIGTSGIVAVGGSVPGEIEIASDRDWFAVELEADRTYQVDLEGSRTGYGTLSSSYLRGIHDADGKFIAGTTNYFGGAGSNSRVTFTATEAGTYYVAAGAYGDRTGTYTLSVLDVTDGIPGDFAAGTDTSGTVEVGTSAMGKIDFWGDRDWFAVELEAGGIYRIDLEGEDTGAGTLRLPYLYGVHDADGVRLDGSMDYGNAELCNSLLYFTAEEDGTYYVAAGAYRDREGTYKLSVTELPDGIPDDFAAGTGTSGTVEVGGSARGEIEIVGDRDWFSVELEAGTTYRIDLEGLSSEAGALFDPYLRGVHDADGVLIAGTTDDNGVRLESRVYFTAEDAGTYYVAAGAGTYGILGGTYKLSVAEVPDDYATGTGTTGAVAVGGSATGEIEFRGDRDWFSVELEAGKTYRIDLKGEWIGNGTLSDPYLHGIHDADGTLIHGTWDDSGGAGTNSRVYFTAAEDATYFVAAGADRDREGTYTLSVTDVTDTFRDDYATGTGTTGAVAVGGSVTGDIEFENDRDWFAVALEAGSTYRIDLKGEWTGDGTLSDPYLAGVHDADGILIAGTTNDDGGSGRNSRVTFTATDAGTYYVAAGAYYGDGEGTYTLSVEEVI